MKRIIVVILAGLLAAAAKCAPVIEDGKIDRPEGSRHYLVMQPGGQPAAKQPLVILLHGHGATAAQMMGLTEFAGYRSEGWKRLAQREGILLIAPDGITASDGKAAWNDCKEDATSNPAVDDVGFISALIDTAIAKYNADPRRIYVFGASNGGTMVYRLGTELGQRFAAIGIQSGLMAAQSRCPAPQHPVSVFISHGTKDKLSPYEGGKVGSWMVKGRGTSIGADDSVAVWRRLAGLPEAPAVFRFPHLQADDKTVATRYTWGNDPARLQVVFIKVNGGGHVGASKTEKLPWLLRALVGDMNHDFNTEEEAWSFFKDKRAAGPAEPAEPA
jgi:polyhydroxybutyrate depolymerase